MNDKRKRSFSPHPFAVLAIILAAAAVMTWLIPAGSFERTAEGLVIPGSYARTQASPVGPWRLLVAVFDGMVGAADIIFLLFFAASYVHILDRTGSINALVGFLLRKLGRRDMLLVPIFMLLFGLCGTAFGMLEEGYGLIAAFIVIAVSLGYDRIVGGAIVFVGAATGFAAATSNPYTIGVASAVSGISMAEPRVYAFRWLCFALFMALSIWYTMRYAARIRRDPAKSFMRGAPESLSAVSRDELLSLRITGRQLMCLLLFIALIALMIVGIMRFGFYLPELSALFFAAFILTGLLGGFKAGEICSAFAEGCRGVMLGALICGFARGISEVMSLGGITDTVVFALSGAVSRLPDWGGGIGMLLVQNLINLFIPSGSGQAVVMMPIMAPLADLIGLSRQTAVLAFQFGDGFSNMFWPTMAAGVAGIMGVGLDRWYRFITPLFLMMLALQCVMMVLAVALGI